jgi:CHAD domain-containing protein
MQTSGAADSPPGAALRDYGLAELAHALDALARRGGHLHGGIHHARKGIRRTRALLALGGKTLGPGAALLDRQLGRVNDRLSPLRDAHALVETLDRLSARTRDETVAASLRTGRRLAAARRAAYARTAEFQETVHEANAMVRTLRAGLHGLPWEGLAAPLVTTSIADTRSRAEAASQRAFAQDTDEDWHRWRRRIRRLSQQHRAATAAGLAPALPLFDKNVAEQLGLLQDLSLLAEHCGRDSVFPKEVRSVLEDFANRSLVRQRKRLRSVVGGVNRS